MRKYKLKASLETTGGLLHINCEMAEDGLIDAEFIDETGKGWTRLFYDRNEVKSYLFNSLHVKNVLRMIESFI